MILPPNSLARLIRSTTSLLVMVALAACENGGGDRVVDVVATGIVQGRVFFDANANRVLDVQDVGIPYARISLLVPGGRDAMLSTMTGVDGTFRVEEVPVGRYLVVIDTAVHGDSLEVMPAAAVTVLRSTSVEYLGVLSYPVHTIAEIRALPVGRKVFVRGTALHDRGIFGDSTVRILDATGALAASRVRAGPLLAGDSLMLRGTVAVRLGQRVLDDVTVFNLGSAFLPAVPTVSTLLASTAGGAGELDAALVRTVDVLVTDTATVAGNLELTVTDATGPLIVQLDRTGESFRPPLVPGLYVPGRRFDIAGVLAPTGTGSWVLRPRTAIDLVAR